MTAPTLAEATKVWGKIGVLSFGGPAAQIALMHREVVDDNKWLTEQQFLNALSFCMLLPGPEAMQLATYAGWRMHGTIGGLIAGLLFVLPGALVILALSGLYAAFGNVPYVDALFLGVKAAVIVIVIEALLKVSRKALIGPEKWAIAGIAFIAIFFFALPFPLIVLLAGTFGFFFGNATTENMATTALQPPIRALKTGAIWLSVWLAPLFALRLALPDSMLNDIAAFFSKLAVVTFGGAYAVLAYMGQDVVENSGWLTAGQMMDGLGLAETTPGPLILVTEFVGFLAAHQQGGFWFGTAAAAVTLWATFAPCFLWIFLGAPYIDWLSTQPKIKGALQAITAAVVGVILNLSIWFALHVLFKDVSNVEKGWITTWIPNWETLDWRVVLLTVLAAVIGLVLKWGILPMLAICAMAGLGLTFIG